MELRLMGCSEPMKSFFFDLEIALTMRSHLIRQPSAKSNTREATDTANVGATQVVLQFWQRNAEHLCAGTKAHSVVQSLGPNCVRYVAPVREQQTSAKCPIHLAERQTLGRRLIRLGQDSTQLATPHPHHSISLSKCVLASFMSVLLEHR